MQQPPLLISFSGMDGAGKSTQIARLHASLQAQGLRVELIAFWDDVARLKNLREQGAYALFRGDKGVGSPEAPILRRDKDVQGWPMTSIRFGLYLVDALSLRRIIHRSLARRDVDVILFDRHSFDELANLDLRQSLNRGWARTITRIVPPMHRSLVLDADPDQAYARKPEYRVEWLRANRAAFHALHRLFPQRITLIPPGSVDQVTEAVHRAVHGVLPSNAP